MLRIRDVYPGSDFFHPGSGPATKNSRILEHLSIKVSVTKLSEISLYEISSRIPIFSFPDPDSHITLLAKVSNDKEQPWATNIHCPLFDDLFSKRLPAGNGRGVRGEQLDPAGNDVRWRARQAPSFLVFSPHLYIFKGIFYEIFNLFNTIKLHHYGTSYRCSDDLIFPGHIVEKFTFKLSTCVFEITCKLC